MVAPSGASSCNRSTTCVSVHDLSGTIKFGSNSRTWPKPVQRGHAPCGLLKLKLRGSNSGTTVLQRTHS